jgi:hypothetical protein
MIAEGEFGREGIFEERAEPTAQKDFLRGGGPFIPTGDVYPQRSFNGVGFLPGSG